MDVLTLSLTSSELLQLEGAAATGKLSETSLGMVFVFVLFYLLLCVQLGFIIDGLIVLQF